MAPTIQAVLLGDLLTLVVMLSLQLGQVMGCGPGPTTWGPKLPIKPAGATENKAKTFWALLLWYSGLLTDDIGGTSLLLIGLRLIRLIGRRSGFIIHDVVSSAIRSVTINDVGTTVEYWPWPRPWRKPRKGESPSTRPQFNNVKGCC